MLMSILMFVFLSLSMVPHPKIKRLLGVILLLAAIQPNQHAAAESVTFNIFLTLEKISITRTNISQRKGYLKILFSRF